MTAAPAAEPPFFVYGTLLPGQRNHDRFLLGRTARERPALLPGALLYEGPGYPYAIEGHGTVHGALVVPAPGAYGELLGLLDRLEQYVAPGHPRNLYERVAREVRAATAPTPTTATTPATAPATTPAPTTAWVYFAAAAVTRSLRTGGTEIPGGNWLTRQAPPAPRTP
ncbi:gamma-glutamylcyclotransferase [Streptomyces finlayi]|uniref:Gamma-glutamylcyclotransferase n=1 Tax=Streptomyces finlayi TaxID=67296 RepID=A0A7G7BQA0_9ACTN|nr:gamma-glutamylcyclotransferase family protein [Streptomyces finlayi]QNE77515.1 gamma-glutamylcyclotransferase [Streptomyces finlayi]